MSRAGRTRRAAAAADGFTLLEVLVSLAILSVALVLAHRVVTGALAAESRAERWTECALLGETLFRETTETFPEIQETDGTFAAPLEEFSWKRSVTQSALYADARIVEISVTWKSGTEEETVSLSGVSVK
ncbi:MAG: prepilin-type N-terminal cleavage/methylation domain-containing protein [Gemmatimonadota bacterium]